MLARSVRYVNSERNCGFCEVATGCRIPLRVEWAAMRAHSWARFHLAGVALVDYVEVCRHKTRSSGVNRSPKCAALATVEVSSVLVLDMVQLAGLNAAGSASGACFVGDSLCH